MEEREVKTEIGNFVRRKNFRRYEGEGTGVMLSADANLKKKEIMRYLKDVR